MGYSREIHGLLPPMEGMCYIVTIFLAHVNGDAMRDKGDGLLLGSEKCENREGDNLAASIVETGLAVVKEYYN